MGAMLWSRGPGDWEACEMCPPAVNILDESLQLSRPCGSADGNRTRYQCATSTLQPPPPLAGITLGNTATLAV